MTEPVDTLGAPAPVCPAAMSGVCLRPFPGRTL